MVDSIQIFSLVVFIGLFSRNINVKKSFYKFARILFVFFILFSIYSTVINISKSKFGGKNRDIAFNDNPILKPFSGVIVYLVAHYPGYQLRRNDSYSESVEPGKKHWWNLEK